MIFQLRLTVLSFILLTFSQIVNADVIFEGYYKVSQFKKHIGFMILRHEVDAKTSNFKTTSFIRLGKNGFDMTETYQVESTSKLKPVKLSYLAAEGKTTSKTIDVAIKNNKMTGTVVENGKKTKVDETIKEDVFFSSALYYLMLNSKGGLKTDSKVDYSAITEEGPVVATGSAIVDKKMVTQGTLQLLKITNKFIGPEYENLVTTEGQVVSAVTKATSIESELVKSSAEALEGIKVAAGTLEKIFGDVPAGKKNVYHSK